MISSSVGWSTHVWKGEEWIGFFANEEHAKAWVYMTDDPALYTINNTGPREKS